MSTFKNTETERSLKMSIEREEALTDTAITVEPTDEALNVDTFDLAGWMAGFHPLTRSCTVYGRPDLLAIIDTVADRAKLAKQQGEDVEALRERAREAAKQIEASAMVFTAQAWSDEKVAAHKAELEKAGITEPEISYHMVAAQIISPAGITAELLKQIEEYSPQQAALIAQTVLKANREVVNPTVPF